MGSSLVSRLNRVRPLAVLLSLVVVVCLNGCTTLKSTNEAFFVGDTAVRARAFQNGKPAPTMINVHDDENTSVAAGKVILRQSGGRLIELDHGGNRHVTFQLDGEQFSFDPNRIFSEDGIRATLMRQGKYSDAARRAVSQFATSLLERFALDHEPVIIALHNTGGGGLSIQSYLPDRELNSAATTVHVSPHRIPGNFFYVTDLRFFDYLKARDFNVTLQDDAKVPDDGSLSVYFARNGIPYVNIEAGLDQLDAQIEMVRVTVKMLCDLHLLDRP